MNEQATATVIMRDTGFVADDWGTEIMPADAELNGDQLALDLAPQADLGALATHLDRIALIRIRFGGFADGRGFTIARRLRAMGYTGRLRAAGHVLADQYEMARRAGFDEVEIASEMARRQPEDQWLARADWRAGDYQARLRG